MNKIILTGFTLALFATAFGCGATSSQDQQRALAHQQSSDEAAQDGHYGVADAEQRAAQEAHHSAVTKAIDEGKSIPPQPKPGDVPAPPPPR